MPSVISYVSLSLNTSCYCRAAILAQSPSSVLGLTQRVCSVGLQASLGSCCRFLPGTAALACHGAICVFLPLLDITIPRRALLLPHTPPPSPTEHQELPLTMPALPLRHHECPQTFQVPGMVVCGNVGGNGCLQCVLPQSSTGCSCCPK